MDSIATSANTNMAALACLGLIAITASYQRSDSPLNSNIHTRTPLYFTPDSSCKLAYVDKPMNVRQKLLSA